MRTRVNLHVYATDTAGRLVYHTLHIGFFPASTARGIAAKLNAIGLAFHSDVARQTGRVDVVICPMAAQTQPEALVRTEEYWPPGAHHAPKEAV